jgi:2,5-diamino-6-(ribosylamino)-4(3H)-pyrimidinone 5'-phosphate reductase
MASAQEYPEWPESSQPDVVRPVVWLNCAMSLDGKLAYSGGKKALLSGPMDMARVQRMRATTDAILIGAGTVRLDDPSLRIHWELIEQDELPPEVSTKRTYPPMRAVFGSRHGLPPKSRILDGSMPTTVFAAKGDHTTYPSQVTVVPPTGSRVDLLNALKWMKRKGVDRLMVEGGTETLTAFVRAKLFDRMTIFVSPVLIGGTESPPFHAGEEVHGPDELVSLKLSNAEMLDSGVLLTLSPQPSKK